MTAYARRRLWALRWLAIVLAGSMLGAGTGACGSAEKKAKVASHAPEGVASSGHGRAESASGRRSGPLLRDAARFRNDGDRDPLGDADGDNRSDNDHDLSLDRQPDDNGRYHDRDDVGFIPFHRMAPPQERRAVTAVVKRYFALAIAGDSRKACAALAPGLAKTVPLQYGRYGPPYLHGAKTCAEILGRVFARRHRELTAPVTVTDVFVGNDEAFVLIGSPRMPASFIDPVRRRGRWFVDEMLGTPFS